MSWICKIYSLVSKHLIYIFVDVGLYVKCFIYNFHIFNPYVATGWFQKNIRPCGTSVVLSFIWRIIKKVVHYLQKSINIPTCLLPTYFESCMYHMKTMWSSVNWAWAVIIFIPLFYYAIIKFPVNIWSIYGVLHYFPMIHIFCTFFKVPL